MKCRYLLTACLVLSITGCAAFTKLEPKPPISSFEGNYIELTKDQDEDTVERFELKSDKKYYIIFPAPLNGESYLVLKTDQLPMVDAYFTNTFDGKSSSPIIIRDENRDPNLLVYKVDNAVPEFYWVIDSVQEDFLLTVDYRYVLAWRYTYENRHADISNRLDQNRVDRKNYNSLGTSFHFNNFNFSTDLNRISETHGTLQSLKAELQDLETMFPANVVNSGDPTYREYTDLKNQINDEITFQENYRDVLNVFWTESRTRSDMNGFLNAAPDFNGFLGQPDRFPPPIIREAQAVLGGRMGGVIPFIEEQLTNKMDANPIAFSFDFNEVDGLYRSTGQNAPSTFYGLRAFVTAYNKEAEWVTPAKTRLEDAEGYADASHRWPSNNHYSEALQIVTALNQMIPEGGTVSFDEYDRLQCVTLLNDEIARVRSQATRLGSNYATAQGVVRQINTRRSQREYRTIIGLLSQYRRLGFLLAQYPDVDQRSLEQQQSTIEVALQSQSWADAEGALKGLYEDEVFLRLNSIARVKRATVGRLEGQLSTAVEQASKERVESFVESNKLTIDNVEGMYQNPVFTPVHTLTFTSGNNGNLAARNAEVQAYIDSLKHDVLPSSAIPAIYQEFQRNLQDRGVDKARAIVIHGKNYKGDNRRVKNLVAECDPYSLKWITKPASYRKVYVLPTTSNQSGENQYIFRLNVRIPTSAKFPVFDINIKLPQEISSDATTTRWYDYITLNKEELKPEGRFTITAPTAANNFEAQLTPVQMKANENNILEIQFTHPSFQVFEISTMSQRPIMRKD